MKIGAKVKELRVQKGLTQEELADRTELSKGFISQLERDLTSPSIATLMDILQALGTDLKDFFNEEPEEQIVFKESDYFEKLDEEYGNKTEWIIPNAQKNIMEPPDACTGRQHLSRQPPRRGRVRLYIKRQHHDPYRQKELPRQKGRILLFYA